MEREKKMKRDNCALCGREITNEDAPILTMGGYGVPRYLCDNCSEQIEIATTATDVKAIAAAVKALGSKLDSTDHDDATTAVMTEILNSAMERGVAIKEGTYDFTLDEKQEDTTFDDIPEELKETEEDKKLDEEEEKKYAKLNSIFNWIMIAAFAAVGAFLIYRIFDSFIM